jgi:transcriptional regulator with XRE-family HTH domain
VTRKLVHHDVGARISQIRRGLGLKRYEFAERLGITKASAGNYERGQMPRADLLDRIAKIGNVTVEWLLHGPTDSASSRRRWEASSSLARELKQLSPRYVTRYETRARLLERRLQNALKKLATQLLREQQRDTHRPTRRSKKRFDASR